MRLLIFAVALFLAPSFAQSGQKTAQPQLTCKDFHLSLGSWYANHEIKLRTDRGNIILEPEIELCPGAVLIGGLDLVSLLNDRCI